MGPFLYSDPEASDPMGPVTRAMLSVSDKTGIVDFARALTERGIELLSTGGTFRLLKENNIPVTEVSDYTGFPEMMDGRVKTLHPKVHGGILERRGVDYSIMAEHGINTMDMFVVNLYPFTATVAKPDCDLPKAIENIDIGGPAIVRSAAKNFDSVMIVTDVSDYSLVLDAMTNDTNTVEFRRDLMIKAYEHTAAYDAMIANYMNKRFNEGFGAKQFIVGEKVMDTRYGENPHQKGALYEFDK